MVRMDVMGLSEINSFGKDELPETHVDMEAYDDISGEPLDPALVINARKSEIEYFRDMGVYEKVDGKECWNVTGRPPSESDGCTSTRATPRTQTTAASCLRRSLTLECARSCMRQRLPVSAYASC